jgi:hypothetical protein
VRAGRASAERHGHVGSLFWPVAEIAEEVLVQLDSPADGVAVRGSGSGSAPAESLGGGGLTPSLAAQKGNMYRAIYALCGLGLFRRFTADTARRVASDQPAWVIRHAANGRTPRPEGGRKGPQAVK